MKTLAVLMLLVASACASAVIVDDSDGGAALLCPIVAGKFRSFYSYLEGEPRNCASDWSVVVDWSRPDSEPVPGGECGVHTSVNGYCEYDQNVACTNAAGMLVRSVQWTVTIQPGGSLAGTAGISIDDSFPGGACYGRYAVTMERLPE